jgi:DnaJ-class molecular chaperone
VGSLYDVLGVPADAGRAELRRAYLAGVRAWHPDRNQRPDAPARFSAIVRAWEVLGDPAGRAAYDASLAAGAARVVFVRRRPWWRRWWRRRPHRQLR